MKHIKHKHFLWKWWFDTMIAYGSMVGSFISLPQLLKIWVEQNAHGVSLITWGGLLFGNIVWLLYGIVHQERPIIFAHLLSVPIMLLIVIGIILYR